MASMGKLVCTLVAGGAMIAAGIMPAWTPFSHWKWWLFSVAMLAFLALVGQLILQRLEDKRENLEQAEQREVIKKLATFIERMEPTNFSGEGKSLGHRHTRDSAYAPEGRSSDDPLIYLEIQSPTEGMFRRTPFVLKNHGKSPAHNVAIQPFKLCRKPVTFPTVGAIPVGERLSVVPTVADGGAMIEHDIFYWLTKDWDGNGELVGEWPVSVSIKYGDPLNQKQFETTMTLVFFPIAYMMNEKHSSPFKQDRAVYEIRNIHHRTVDSQTTA